MPTYTLDGSITYIVLSRGDAFVHSGVEVLSRQVAQHRRLGVERRDGFLLSHWMQMQARMVVVVSTCR